MEWADALGAFERALQRFREVLAEPETTVVRDAAIKRFEFTFELGWKAAQRFLRAGQPPLDSHAGRPKPCRAYLRRAHGPKDIQRLERLSSAV